MIPAILAALGEAGAAGAAGEGASGVLGSLAGAAGGGASGGMGSLMGGAVQKAAGGAMTAINKLAHPLQTLEEGFQKLYHTVNFLPTKILEVEHMITTTAANWVNALAAPIDTVKKLGDAVTRFTRLSNPGGSQLFDMHVENAMATLGNTLQPILDALDRTAIRVGDIFAKLKPAMEPVIQAISRLADPAMDSLATAAELLAPPLQLVSQLLLGQVNLWKQMQAPLTEMQRQFLSLRKTLYDFLGVSLGFDQNGKSDVAARTPTLQSTEDMHRELSKNAILASYGAKPEETTQSILSDFFLWVRTNLNPDMLAARLGAAIAKIYEDLKNRVADNIPDAPNVPGLSVVADNGGHFGLAGAAAAALAGAIDRQTRQE